MFEYLKHLTLIFKFLATGVSILFISNSMYTGLKIESEYASVKFKDIQFSAW